MRILIVDGNTEASDTAHTGAGGRPTGEHYAAMLRGLNAQVRCTLVHPARTGSAGLPAGMSLAGFDGVAWTGSALNLYDGGREVAAQIELCQAAFETGVPQFGSCWGLQVAAAAAGGEVAPNPRGRELGIARGITVTSVGIQHPLLAGKGVVYEAIAVHLDEIRRPPPRMILLAGNAVSRVQAAEIRHAHGVCWGTQYHPEYDLNEIATVIQRYGRRLVEAGFFADEAAQASFVADLRALHADPRRTDLAWRYGIGADVLNSARRHWELRRWLEVLVRPRAQQARA